MVWNISLYEHFLKALRLYLEARIRTRIEVKGTDPDQSDKQDPDPDSRQSDVDPQH
jgi:hypothetical protein